MRAQRLAPPERLCDRSCVELVRLLFTAFLAALALPGLAWATAPTFVARDLPLHGRTLAGVEAPLRFDLVGLHWQGRGTVRFRTRSLGGHWSAWQRGAPEAEDQPDRSSPEARRRRGWRLGNPFWAGPSDRIEYRVSAGIRRLRANYVRSPMLDVPLRATSVAASPAIMTRSTWGAAESIRRSHPEYAAALRLAVVHHTAGSTNYSRAESPAIVRAIEVYHVKGNGWNDIGYNFLVDKYGQVFEGRYGGIARNVVGAHAQGFNTGSVGVSLLGSYDSTSPSAAATAALVRLLAWRLDLGHVDPISTLTYLSNGNPRFPTGAPVFLRAVSGHRDTGFTTCPGNALYRRISSLAQGVAKTGLPKLYSPSVTGSIGGRMRFRARLSSALPWIVTIGSPGGKVASGAGTSAAVDWTWDARKVPRQRYGYTITAGPVLRGVRGIVGVKATTSPPPTPPPAPRLPLIGTLGVTPTLLTPNGDGVDDVATVAYTLGSAAAVTATLTDSFGATVATLFAAYQTGGKQSFTLVPEGVLPGVYTLVVSASGDDGRQAAASATLQIA